MFNFIYEIFGWVLKLFNSITGNYLVAIMLFALLMKVVFFPLGFLGFDMCLFVYFIYFLNIYII